MLLLWITSLHGNSAANGRQLGMGHGMIGDTLKRFAQLASIRSRLILAFSALLGLLLALSVMASHRLEALGASMHQFVDQPARLALLAERANQHSQYAAIQLLRLLQTPERDRRIPLYAQMDAAMTASDAAIAGLAHADNRAYSQAHIAHATELRQRYERLSMACSI